MEKNLSLFRVSKVALPLCLFLFLFVFCVSLSLSNLFVLPVTQEAFFSFRENLFVVVLQLQGHRLALVSLVTFKAVDRKD